MFYFNNGEEQDTTLFKENFHNYMITSAIITLCCSLPSVISAKSRPKIPPSISQQNIQQYNITLRGSLKMIFRNYSFISLLISFACINGFYLFYSITINDYLEVYFISDSMTSYLIIGSFLGGIVGSIILSILVDRIRTYKIMFIILNSLVVLLFALLLTFFEIFNLHEDKLDHVWLIAGFALYGLFMMPLISISMDLVCELTFPVRESIPLGIILSASHLTGLFSTFLIDVVFLKYDLPKYLPNLYSLGLLFISLISLILFKGIYKF
jgi:Na+/melibiose symporter-like transporter